MIVNGIPINLKRKKIKHMHLYVKPPDGRVEVSAPLNMSDDIIEKFIRSKEAWIRRHQQRIENLPRPKKNCFIDGEELIIWGSTYELVVQFSNKGNNLSLEGNKAILTVREASTVEQRRRYVKEWYRTVLKKEINRVLPYWINFTGLCPSSWQIKDMKTRWGTCNTKTRKIWLNLQLAKCPPICLEYVILHELIHLVEGSHNKKFTNLMDHFMPNWREVKHLLNGTH
ncbi:MAG: M48 family metallopeptidase [Clostridiaceae bacterium]|nr:M48 family metallopeptidase [Clostridiaceae bacterium]